MKRSVSVIAGIIIMFAFAYLAISWYFSSQVIVYDSVPMEDTVAATENESTSEARDDEERWRPQFDVPNQETIDLEVNDVTLMLDYYENEADADCGVIFLHGFSGDRQNVGLYGPMFYELGCDVVAYDARSHGESESAYMTFGYYERYEAEAVILWLAEKSDLEVSQIGMVGISYGAVTALQALTLQPDVAFVVSDSAHQDMRTTVTEQAVAVFGEPINLISLGAFTMMELRANINVDEVSSIRAVEEATSPILLLHSNEDTYIMPYHSEAIYEAANPETTQLILQDYGSPHAESILDNPEDIRNDVYTFLNDYRPDFGDLQSVLDS